MAGANEGGSPPPAGKSRTIAVDNFLRKGLRVSDPRDPAQTAGASRARDPEEAERERRERAGVQIEAGRNQQTKEAK